MLLPDMICAKALEQKLQFRCDKRRVSLGREDFLGMFDSKTTVELSRRHCLIKCVAEKDGMAPASTSPASATTTFTSTANESVGIKNNPNTSFV